MNYKDKYDLWINSSFIDEDTKGELKNIKEEKEIEDRFYKDLEFGTGGLRGVIGAGSNRLNVYTVGKATEGFGRYLKDKFENPSVAIAHDSRNMSKEFAEYAGRVLAANGVKVYLFETLTPTPILSYGVRELKCSGGIVITASHNPKEYNGYKVYGADGGQVTDIPAKEIIGFVNGVNSFEDVNVISKEEALENGMLNYVGEDVYSTYVEKVKDLTIRKELVQEHAKDLNIIYTPIHGTGNIPVRRVLKELGYENVRVVKEQELPNGNFPTAPYPNPEDKQVFTIALDMAKTEAADIILGTDPDCDRIGVVVKDNTGEYRVLNGNQVGVLLSHYMISSLKYENRLPNGATIVNTIVSTNMVNPICREYGVEVREVLTGFKYIGELIGKFEKETPRKNSFLFGYEESYGYLAGDFVRDKDAVIAATLICEMTLYYKSLGKTLYEALIDLYDKYGYYKEKLISITLKGKEGQEKIASIIEALRNGTFKNFGEFKVAYKEDYKLSYKENVNTGDKEEITLPKSNVIKFIFDDEAYFVVRPSGTEPKIKIYLGVIGNSISDAENKIINLENEVNNLLKTI
ncbi:phospho-sugar mutase [Hathewaya limosa]|uniref:Phosphoglucomutase n=1 Tax=Hathewaya limosa TaxID=1536 RepID=A0ABU0JUK6_HATLI|nr:phospho-sugar mutase [Hathewaya limosa]MDQ0480784.1 phosphoglucomutase [Hathewaya limosa]